MTIIPDISIREEQEGDRALVFEINKQAFGRPEEAMLVDQLRKSAAFIPELSLVAVVHSKVVGHILFTQIKIHHPDQALPYTTALALAPLAVLPGFQHNGIGGALITNGLRIATALGHNAVIVMGHEAYYPKFGFIPAEKWQIKAPFEVPESNFMAVELIPHALDHAAGTVEYAREFGIM
ncbi:N-acetyltransferase [Chitinophaga pendula]|uniref:GNAT family N-acetyltransferase n=1 Tax=Chitinophaga TaxID=79328 RepID=UPI000BAEE9B7|nr:MULTISPECIES: N-acetyltransferase [Chitinophaga]ASZ12731.1 GNAT family N-acetyltransferase [Chitinophaga sp. MD30]UCJ09651.1 N-acetyltransferase [Chitinophaga pendula]